MTIIVAGFVFSWKGRTTLTFLGSGFVGCILGQLCKDSLILGEATEVHIHIVIN